MTTAGFLREQKILRLATVGPGGMPHVVPVWYRYSRGRFYVGTNLRTAKARNLRRNDRVGFCIDVGVNSPDIRGISGRGRARLILEKGKVARIATQILSRYFKTMEHKSARELLEDTDCIIEIVPEGISEWRY